MPTGLYESIGDTRQWAGPGRVESQHFEWDTATPAPDGRLRHRPALAGFDFLAYLGGGGMGDVYLARETAADRLVAVKFLRAAADPQSAARFRKEIRALAKLDHPNIVRVYSVDLERADPFFTMEHAAGGSLADRIKPGERMPPMAAARLASDLAGALAATHAADILHRDIKPGNILFDEKGTPKLGDFGLAKTLGDQNDTQTGASRALGTPPFMPPEAVTRRHGEFSAASDVYGLGATLYFMLTGRAPFSGEHHEVMRQVEQDEPPRPRSINDSIPMGLEGIVLKCLAKRPEDRYTSAEELAGSLEKFLAGEEDSGTPWLTRRRRVNKWLARNRRTLLAGMAGLFVVGLAVTIGNLMATPKPPPPDPNTWEAIRDEWQAGRRITQIGERGKPRWHRWIMGAPELGSSITGDESCSFEVSGFGLLELCPQPPSSHYRVHAKIRFSQSKYTGGPVDGTTSAGLYFGRSECRSAAGDRVHPMFAVTFNDLPVKSANPRGVQLRSAAIVQREGTSAYGPTRGFGSTTYESAGKLPGPWRPISIEVSENGAVASWETKGQMQPFASPTAGELRTRYAKLRDELDGTLGKNHGVAIPEWNPRMPFGIWSYRASIDVKDVIIEPLNE